MLWRKWMIYPTAFFVIILAGCIRQDDFPVLKGPYLGQKPPGLSPEIFAPGIVSKGAWEYGTAFSKDGKEFYFAVSGAPYNVIVSMKEVNGIWTKPEIASFSGKYDEHDMLFSPDGKKLYYTSKRPLISGDEPEKEESIWVVTKKENGWSEPDNLGDPINTAGSENYSSVSLNGTMYFHRYEQPTNKTDSDIFVARFIDGKYEEPERLGPNINSKYDEWDPFIAPDESYLIFSSVRRPDAIGVVDMYICFRKEDGSWTPAKNMGEGINSSGSENCAMVTPDGKYFFFMSTRRIHKSYSEIPITLAEKFAILNRYGNGNADIYWVDAKIIEENRKEILVTSAQESEHLKKVVNEGYGDYLLVPAGEFEMGDNFNEGHPDEHPVHKVYLSDYYIGKYEVTNSEYKKFIDDGGYENPSYWSAGGFGEFGTQPLYWDNNTDADPRNSQRGTTFYEGRHVHGGGVPGHENFPVNGVSWHEAMAYCSWLSSKTGHKYRLPTEAEWEKAARGSYEHNRDNPELGHQRRYPWGDDLDNSYGNFWNSGDPYDNGTTPVGYYDGSKHGSYQTKNNASPYGAYDMTGNVFEWCLDWYVRSEKDEPHSSLDYQKRHKQEPVVNPRGPLSGEYACLRSSDWHHNAVSEKDKYYHNPRCASRNYDPPHWRGANFGFRCVREK